MEETLFLLNTFQAWNNLVLSIKLISQRFLIQFFYKNLAGPARKDPRIFFRRHPLHEISSSFLYVSGIVPSAYELHSCGLLDLSAGMRASEPFVCLNYVFSSNHDNGLGRFGFRTGVISAGRVVDALQSEPQTRPKSDWKTGTLSRFLSVRSSTSALLSIR